MCFFLPKNQSKLLIDHSQKTTNSKSKEPEVVLEMLKDSPDPNLAENGHL